MQLGLTIVGQMLSFSAFVWFTFRFIWPPFLDNMESRRKKIADGLAAAEKGKFILSQARSDIEFELKRALKHREEILALANKNAAQIIEEARFQAKLELENLLKEGQNQLAAERDKAQRELLAEVSELITLASEKLIQRNLHDNLNQNFLAEMLADLKARP